MADAVESDPVFDDVAMVPLLSGSAPDAAWSESPEASPMPATPAAVEIAAVEPATLPFIPLGPQIDPWHHAVFPPCDRAGRYHAAASDGDGDGDGDGDDNAASEALHRPWEALTPDPPAQADELADAADTDGWCLGVDEAGRGPVLGPMVYACAFVPVAAKRGLRTCGFDDSKVLTESQRRRLFHGLAGTPWLGYALTVLTPQSISAGMLARAKVNLNTQAHDTTIALIARVLDRGYHVRQVYIDTVGPPETYQAKLAKRFPQIDRIVVAKKADALYPVVSAASIVAKVTRDAVLAGWAPREHGAAGARVAASLAVMGSGYPGDPKTVAWLQAHRHPVFGFPDVVRFSWSTAAVQMDKACVAVVWPEDLEAADGARRRQQSTLAAFGARKRKATTTATAAMAVDDHDGDADDADCDAMQSGPRTASRHPGRVGIRGAGNEAPRRPGMPAGKAGLRHVALF